VSWIETMCAVSALLKIELGPPSERRPQRRLEGGSPQVEAPRSTVVSGPLDSGVGRPAGDSIRYDVRGTASLRTEPGPPSSCSPLAGVARRWQPAGQSLSSESGLPGHSTAGGDGRRVIRLETVRASCAAEDRAGSAASGSLLSGSGLRVAARRSKLLA
jgi:hypothetical protein